jgi:CRP-like cAMP-binding protein
MARRRSILQSTASRPPPSSRHRSPFGASRNRLLAALPFDDHKRVAPSLEVVPLKLKQLLHKPGEQVDYVYFPGGGFCSIVTVLADGSMVEVATIGREGMVGLSPVMSESPMGASAVMVQGETETCYRMPAGAFRREMDRRGVFYQLHTRYADALMGFVMQSTACNAVHSVEQRLARWLLMAHDRMGRNEFPLTQEFAAMMLGAARPTVTVVAGTLQKAGLITYHRGKVTIVDRRKLEAASCECYRTATHLLEGVTSSSR